MQGSCTNIGFVYKPSKAILNNIFKCLFKYLDIFKITEINCLQADEEWVKLELKSHDFMCIQKNIEKIYSASLFNIIASFSFNKELVSVEICNENISELNCLLFCIEDKSMFKAIDNVSNTYENALKIYTHFVEKLIKDILLEKICVYCFCDNDAAMQYNFEEIKNGKYSEYSIINYLSENGELIEQKSRWQIDGFTPRLVG